MSRKDVDEQRSVLKIWKQKLTFLKREQAIAASPVEQFELKIRIEECQEEIERINSQLKYPQRGEQLISNQPTSRPEIGIITALPKEYAAVQKTLENTQKVSFSGQGRGRQYLLGEVSINNEEKHAVVLCLASMGNNAASIRASSLLNHFPYLKSIIMVGIAGGIPHPREPEDHVRLGDIVISNEKGVIQYDFSKETITDTTHRYPP